MWLDLLNKMKKSSGKTTEQISIESGIPKGTLNKLFAGQTKDPQYSTLKAVVHCLGYTVDDLDEEKVSESKILDPETETLEDFDFFRSLLMRKGYLQKDGDISAADANFLIALIDLFDAYFENRK